jgi:hypothetical protein
MEGERDPYAVRGARGREKRVEEGIACRRQLPTTRVSVGIPYGSYEMDEGEVTVKTVKMTTVRRWKMCGICRASHRISTDTAILVRIY